MIKQLERSARNAAEENILHHRMKRLEACRRARDLLVLEAEANARARIGQPASQRSAKAEMASTGARYDSSGRLGNFQDPGYAFDTDHKGYALHEAMRKMMETEGLDAIGRSAHVNVESDPLNATRLSGDRRARAFRATATSQQKAATRQIPGRDSIN